MEEQHARDRQGPARYFSPWSAYAFTLLAIVSLTAFLVPVRDRIGELNVGLLYLILVLLIASHWGWSIGFFACTVSYLALDYFFIPPRSHLLYGAPADVLALAIFLATAALASALLARAQFGEAAARRRRDEITTLFELSRAIIVGPDSAMVLASICARVAETLRATGCAVLLPGTSGLTVAASGGELACRPLRADETALVQRALAQRHIAEHAAPRAWRLPWRPKPAQVQGWTICLPLRLPSQGGGVLLLTDVVPPQAGTDEFLALLDAFADEVALALERDRLLCLAAHAEAVEETDKLRAALLATVSHDLRTPLASIKAAASCLLDPELVWDDATRRELLTAIDEETDRLTRLVSNLLDLSRIESGAIRPDLQWLDVRELLDTVTSRLRRVLTDHKLVVDTEPAIGDARLDYVQTGQVLTNLIENAAKFAPAGTTIRVSARREPDGVELAVQDEGPGIPPEERQRVFLKFYRGSHVEGRPPGSGLGLAISNGLVEAHGGRIRAEDAPGGGARFVVWLPSPTPPPPSYIPGMAQAR